MSKQTILIDNLAFAKKSEQLSGILTLENCPRLTEQLLKATITYHLQGELNTVGQHYLHIQLVAELVGTCQRCLGEMPLNIDLNFTYLIGEINVSDLEAVDSDTGFEDSDSVDFQQASQSMDLIALIEDEIIMAMPIAPTHTSDCGKLSTQSGEKPNPFAVLKSLIKP